MSIATKAYINALMKCLEKEWKDKGVDIMTCLTGEVKTKRNLMDSMWSKDPKSVAKSQLSMLGKAGLTTGNLKHGMYEWFLKIRFSKDYRTNFGNIHRDSCNKEYQANVEEKKKKVGKEEKEEKKIPQDEEDKKEPQWNITEDLEEREESRRGNNKEPLWNAIEDVEEKEESNRRQAKSPNDSELISPDSRAGPIEPSSTDEIEKVLSSSQGDIAHEHRIVKENGKIKWINTHVIFAIDCSGITK